MLPEPRENRLEGSKADYFVALRNNSTIDTVDHGALVLDETRKRVANIYLIGSILKDHPRFKAIVAQMSELFPSVINSFRFLPEDGNSTMKETP